MNNEIKTLIKKVASKLYSDCYHSSEEFFAKIRAAHELYQEDENNAAGCIFDLNNKEDFALLLKSFTPAEMVDLYQRCVEKNCFYILYGEYYEKPTWVENIRGFIANSATELATCVVAYPHCEVYRELYCAYVTDEILKECDEKYTNIREFADLD